MVDEKRMEELVNALNEFDAWEDTSDPAFRAFMKATLLVNIANQPGDKRIFQTFHYDAIGLPALWSPDDMSRGVVEGWAIGNMVQMQSRFPGLIRPPPRISSTICIGKFSRYEYGQIGIHTFISDQDAHDWVSEQADRKGDQFGVYRRALAVVAALTLKQSL